MNAALEPALEPGPNPVARRLLSADEYQRMGEVGILGPDERVELIEGEIIVMPPSGPVHASIVDRLNRSLFLAVGERAIVRVQNPLRLSERSEPEPDLALLRPRDDFYASAAPGAADTLLAIEVSHSTLRYDRDVKVPFYARHGVPEIWLIDVAGERLVRYREPGGKGYAHELALRSPGTLEPALLEGAAVDLAGLFGTD